MDEDKSAGTDNLSELNIIELARVLSERLEAESHLAENLIDEFSEDSFSPSTQTQVNNKEELDRVRHVRASTKRAKLRARELAARSRLLLGSLSSLEERICVGKGTGSEPVQTSGNEVESAPLQRSL